MCPAARFATSCTLIVIRGLCELVTGVPDADVVRRLRPPFYSTAQVAVKRLCAVVALAVNRAEKGGVTSFWELGITF